MARHTTLPKPVRRRANRDSCRADQNPSSAGLLRAAGGWPLGSSLRRRQPRPVGGGGVATPRPQPFPFPLLFLFFSLALCSYAGLSNRVTERDSAVRGCRAALSHMVPFVCCLLPCLIVLFLSFSWHTHLIADIRFSTRC